MKVNNAFLYLYNSDTGSFIAEKTLIFQRIMELPLNPNELQNQTSTCGPYSTKRKTELMHTFWFVFSLWLYGERWKCG